MRWSPSMSRTCSLLLNWQVFMAFKFKLFFNWWLYIDTTKHTEESRFCFSLQFLIKQSMIIIKQKKIMTFLWVTVRHYVNHAMNSSSANITKYEYNKNVARDRADESVQVVQKKKKNSSRSYSSANGSNKVPSQHWCKRDCGCTESLCADSCANSWGLDFRENGAAVDWSLSPQQHH